MGRGILNIIDETVPPWDLSPLVGRGRGKERCMGKCLLYFYEQHLRCRLCRRSSFHSSTRRG